jgi:hypothetical protein
MGIRHLIHLVVNSKNYYLYDHCMEVIDDIQKNELKYLLEQHTVETLKKKIEQLTWLCN